MPAANRSGLHAVETSEEFRRKIKAHRRNIRIIIAVVVAVIVAAIIGLKIYFDNKEYTDYEVVAENPRDPGALSEYRHFAGGVLKFNYDGATFFNASGNLVWNQPYELENPEVSVSDRYAAVYEKNGKKLYLMSDSRACAGIDTTVAIKRVSMSDNGTAAVLMEEDGVGRITLYSESGEMLANGEIYSQNTGYPTDIAISQDGRLLAAAILNISEAKLTTNIIFYNFGTVGRNEVDNIVASYSYDGLVVPRFLYLKGDYAVAVSSAEAIVFSGSQKPVEYARFPIFEGAKSLIWDSGHFGFVYDDHIDVFTPDKGKIYTYEDDFDKCEVCFLDNGEISAIGDGRIGIYDMNGIKRYSGQGDTDIIMVLPKLATHYLFIYSDMIKEVRLK